MSVGKVIMFLLLVHLDGMVEIYKIYYVYTRVSQTICILQANENKGFYCEIYGVTVKVYCAENAKAI